MQYLPSGSLLLDHHIVRLEALGAVNIFIVIGYLGSDIETYVKGRHPRCRVIHQEGKLGTAADGLLASEKYVHDDFVVVHGDHYFSENPFACIQRRFRFLLSSVDILASYL
jgi:NDP-sugar pyrophosphorylase family protein